MDAHNMMYYRIGYPHNDISQSTRASKKGDDENFAQRFARRRLEGTSGVSQESMNVKSITQQFQASVAQSVEFFTPDEHNEVPILVRVDGRRVDDLAPSASGSGSGPGMAATSQGTLANSASRGLQTAAAAARGFEPDSVSSMPTLPDMSSSAMAMDESFAGVEASFYDIKRPEDIRDDLLADDLLATIQPPSEGNAWTFLYCGRVEGKGDDAGDGAVDTDEAPPRKFPLAGLLMLAPKDVKSQESVRTLILRYITFTDKVEHHVACYYKRDILDWSDPARWLGKKVVELRGPAVLINVMVPMYNVYTVVCADYRETVQAVLRQILGNRGIEFTGGSGASTGPGTGPADKGDKGATAETEAWYAGLELRALPSSDTLPPSVWQAAVDTLSGVNLVVSKVATGEREDDKIGLKLAAWRSSAFRTVSKITKPQARPFPRPATDSPAKTYERNQFKNPLLLDAEGRLGRLGARDSQQGSTGLSTSERDAIQNQVNGLFDDLLDAKEMLRLFTDRVEIDDVGARNVVGDAIATLQQGDVELRNRMRIVQNDNDQAQRRLRQLEDVMGDLRDIMDMQEDKLEVATQRMQAFIERKPANPLARLLWALLTLFLAVGLSLLVLFLHLVRLATDGAYYLFGVATNTPVSGSPESDTQRLVSFEEDLLKKFATRRDSQWNAIGAHLKLVSNRAAELGGMNTTEDSLAAGPSGGHEPAEPRVDTIVRNAPVAADPLREPGGGTNDSPILLRKKPKKSRLQQGKAAQSPLAQAR